MNEPDFIAIGFFKRRKLANGFRDKGMRNGAHIAAWNFSVFQESAVHVSDVHRLDQFVDRSVPLGPFVDIGQVEHGSAGAGDFEADGLGKFVPMRDLDRSDFQMRRNGNGRFLFQALQGNVVQGNELAPRTIGF